MQLTDQQYGALAEAYAAYIVDTMDTKCLAQFALDCIIENLPLNPEDLITEIRDTYDQETLDDLLLAIN